MPEYRGTGWCSLGTCPPRSVLANVGFYSQIPSLLDHSSCTPNCTDRTGRGLAVDQEGGRGDQGAAAGSALIAAAVVVERRQMTSTRQSAVADWKTGRLADWRRPMGLDRLDGLG